MKTWTSIVEIGKAVNKVLLFVFIISLVIGIGGWIADAEWVSTAWSVAGYSAFFIFKKIKEKRLS